MKSRLFVLALAALALGSVACGDSDPRSSVGASVTTTTEAPDVVLIPSTSTTADDETTTTTAEDETTTTTADDDHTTTTKPITATTKPTTTSARPLTTAPSPKPVQVLAKGLVFKPAKVTIPKGGKVVWTFGDATIPHNVTFKAFHSDNETSGTYSHVFKAAGSFPYTCTIHPTMKGNVTVK